MKKLFVAVAALATMLFVSCSKEQMTEAKLQGTWTVKSVDVKVYESGKEIELPATIKGFLVDMGVDDVMKNLPEGSTLTFSKGKAISTYSDGSNTYSSTSDYTISGDTLTIKPQGESAINMTVKEATSSKLVLTIDALKMGELPAEAQELIKNYSILIILTLYK